MRDAPAALSHLGSPFVNDPTELTALVFLRAYHVQGARHNHLVSVPQACEMNAEQLAGSWKPLRLNTANCAPGRGKMQVSFSRVGTGGAHKTPPLSLGTWPTGGQGYEAALQWYANVQSTLQPLRGKVGPEDERVQRIKVQCQQAAKAECKRVGPAKVCLVLNISSRRPVLSLSSAYPQPTL